MEPVNSVTIYPYQKILNILFYTNSKKIGSTLPKDSLKSLWMSLELANCEQHRYPMHITYYNQDCLFLIGDITYSLLVRKITDWCHYLY